NRSRASIHASRDERALARSDGYGVEGAGSGHRQASGETLMFAPIFDTLESNAAAVAALGSPLRAFSFGEVVGQPTATPYLVWQNISGTPYNYLGQLPDKDDVSLQVDVYDATAAGARETARIARDALEGVCYM